MSEPPADGWNTFGMSRPGKDAYLTRAKTYLNHVMPTDIAVIIMEYGSSLHFYIDGLDVHDVALDSIEYPPRQLPAECSAEFVRHVRILASVQAQDTIYDLLSDGIWRERSTKVWTRLAAYVWNPHSTDSIASAYPADGYLIVYDHMVPIFNCIHEFFRWRCRLEFTETVF